MSAQDVGEVDPGLAYRKQHFAVEIEPNRYPLEPGELSLRTTTNGYQWTSIPLLISEAKAVIEALAKAIPQPEAPASGTPRTDAVAIDAGMAGPDVEHAPADFARTLETELASALARLAKAEALVGKWRELSHSFDNDESASEEDYAAAHTFGQCADELSAALKE